MALTVAHVVPGFGLVATALPALVKVAIWMILALSLFGLLLRQRHLPVALKLHEDGRLFLVESGGGETERMVDPATTVTRWLIVMRFKSGLTVDSLVLPVDALGGEAHRQLRTWLLWRANVDPA